MSHLIIYNKSFETRFSIPGLSDNKCVHFQQKHNAAHYSTVGQLDAALTNHWTQSNGQSDKAFVNHWTLDVGPSTIGQFDTFLAYLAILSIFAVR